MEYDDLYPVIPDVWDRFDFMEYYDHERTILTPALIAKGFSDITFHMGERDSFGPLSRIVRCTDPNGDRRQFVYA